ncbi:carbonic anhydrase 2-like [Musca autumnalis]|uniref:carbonic anhydrase 2-like n=1 Tax=Musca autumnalis TaxID=221902 RepID=UPI003CF76715
MGSVSSTALQQRSPNEWSYDNCPTWGQRFPKCNGQLQSPIHLQTSKAFFPPLAPIQFLNYNIPLPGNLTLSNNGHTISLPIPPTENGARPCISGGKLPGTFEAIRVHFHWGSRTSRGAEHVINGQRFDAELHIVHKNVKYATFAEAAAYEDGVAVLAIMVNIGRYVDRIYPAIDAFINMVPRVATYQSTTPLGLRITLGHLLGDVNTSEFFTYPGSLTTPDCSESVTWTVFPYPIYISLQQMQKFWSLRDHAITDNIPTTISSVKIHQLGTSEEISDITTQTFSMSSPMTTPNRPNVANFLKLPINTNAQQ